MTIRNCFILSILYIDSEARSNYIENAKLLIINLYSSYFINNKENIMSPINTHIIQNEFETAYEKLPDAQLPNLNFNLDKVK